MVPPSPDTSATLDLLQRIAAQDATERCLIAPSPELIERMRQELTVLRDRIDPMIGMRLRLQERRPPGFNDSLIIPGNLFPAGTSLEAARRAGAERAPLRGTVRVIVVLAEFGDAAMMQPVNHFENLFFSTGVLAGGSVREFFTEASHGLIDLTGQVVGPFRLPQTLVTYAHGDSGTGAVLPNARTMARDAATAANPVVNFGPYDNDGNGFVDAFVVVHAGPAAEVTGDVNHIWSHKWVLPSVFAADTTQIYAYLTVPEDARVGVCAHELGHLIFGWPDLYDSDYGSEGVGNWCLMGGGSWNGGGDRPAHPSAWCKVNQGWVSVVNQTTNQNVSIQDVKAAHTVYRLWKDGGPGPEYFLVENRQKAQFDDHLPGGGLLIWHVDDSTTTNDNEAHYKVALMQADGKRHLELGNNRGDAGDPYPGSANNDAFTSTSTPNSKSYAGVDTCVAVTNISASGPTMTARLSVRCGIVVPPIKPRKPLIWDKLLGEKRPDKFLDKGVIGEKRPEKPITDKRGGFDKPPIIEGGGGGFGWPAFWGGGPGPRRPVNDGWDEAKERGAPAPRDVDAAEIERLREQVNELATRVEELESGARGGEPFIDSSRRPDLSGGALLGEPDVDDLQRDMRQGDPQAKRLFDSRPPEG